MTLPSETVPSHESKILIIDDEASNRDIISQFLKLEGYQVFTAVDGEDGLEKVAEIGPDLVLLDVLMPRIGGYEVCRQLKANPDTVFLPVVMITALKGTDEKIKGVEVGADDFLTKPFNNLELVTRVKSLLRVKHLHDALERYNRELEERVAERTAQLQEALENLRELDRLKSEFMGNVSHELRTPLLHVKGYVALLADGTLGPLTEEQSLGLDTTHKAVEVLEQLIDDIIDFGWAEAGQLLPEAAQIRQAAELALNVVQTTLQGHAAQVSIDCPADLPPALADQKALARILRHLLDNAIKFSPDGGNIQLRARMNEKTGRLRIEVQDQGIGIEPDKINRIFDSFYQADGSTTRRFGGTGIGLALVKHLLAGHGSQIEVESEVGRGSTFSFELDVAP